MNNTEATSDAESGPSTDPVPSARRLITDADAVPSARRLVTDLAAQFHSDDVVSYGSGGQQMGIVVDVEESDFEWPLDPDADSHQTIEASRDGPVYLVATINAGLKPFAEDDLTESEFEGEPPDTSDLTAATPAPIYNRLDDPYDADEITDLLNIPGIRDPEIGFAPGEPEGWTRKSYLQAYIHLGGSWRSCVANMTGDVSRPKRWCSALKDEVYMTTHWRK